MGTELPRFADELKRRYLRGEASQFVLHGNVHDLVLHNGALMGLGEFLSNVLLAPSRDVVVHYNLSSGVRFSRKKAEVLGLDELLLQKSADKVLPALERLLLTMNKVAVIVDYAEMIAPVGDANFFSEADRQSVISLHRWSLSPIVERNDNLVILVAENLSELHPKLVANPRVATIAIPMPDDGERRAVIELVAPALAKTQPEWVDRLAEVTAGLKTVQIKTLLEPPAQQAESAAEREQFIRSLLGEADNATERAKKLAALTQGMSREEVRELLAPKAPTRKPDKTSDKTTEEKTEEEKQHEEVLRLIYRRKREIIERECFGLIEFVEPRHDFSVVGGMEEVKRELRAVAKNLREGRRARCPMGILFTGPMGTGKTFVAEAFARESRLTAIKLKNFRSKWVGATEGNLDRILSVIQAIGQVIVIIDEGDRAFGNQEGEGDGGTSARVIARIKEFMSDGGNRGRILFLLMTNRPDKLDVDIKRAGRLDRKIPFLYPQDEKEVESVVVAQLRKHEVNAEPGLFADPGREELCRPMIGYSNADIEAVVLMAQEAAGDSPLKRAHITDAVKDYLPSADQEMLEYMELIAVFEASNRRMLPKKYQGLSSDELNQRLTALKARVGARR